MRLTASLQLYVNSRLVRMTLTASLQLYVDEFAKMKDEVPPALIDTHVKSVESALKEGRKVDTTFGLDKSGIAGTVPDKEDGE